MDYIAGAFEILAMILVGQKNKYGFISGLVCNVLWILYVIINQKTFGLLMVVIPMLFINVNNYLLWSGIDLFKNLKLKKGQ
jgi:hypothetical protein